MLSAIARTFVETTRIQQKHCGKLNPWNYRSLGHVVITGVQQGPIDTKCALASIPCLVLQLVLEQVRHGTSLRDDLGEAG